ncbi:hypothetical protein QBC44DRAFT_127311 [Cladorrhinum sp. PSN332]|nr:hypothetical protein QBC44DRAFT_127311 [Cladorrhinum sp. PSN332]
MFFSRHPLRVFLTLIFFLVNLSASTVCVWPNGDTAPKSDLEECGRKAPTMCCAPGDICMSNGLCVGPNTTFYRGGCTDGHWFESSCPSYCLDGHQDTAVLISSCHVIDRSKQQRWVCGTNITSCNNKSDMLRLDGNMTPVATVAKMLVEPTKAATSQGQSARRYTSLETSFVQASSAASSPQPPPPQSSAASPPTTTEPVFPSPEMFVPPEDHQPTSAPGQDLSTPTQSPTFPPETPPSPPPEDKSTNSSKAIPIAVGLGAGASIMIIGSIVFFFFARGRHNRNHSGPARAETPPPLEFHSYMFDDDHNKPCGGNFFALHPVTKTPSPPTPAGIPIIVSSNGRYSVDDFVSGLPGVHRAQTQGEGHRTDIFEMP